MRPEHVSGPEAGGRRETEERAHSPSPSFSGSYGYEGEEDYDSEEDVHGRESEGASATERSIQDPTPAGSSSGAQLPKPKRTRQLTTPHQSAVLHALLAQVNIWFSCIMPDGNNVLTILLVAFSDDPNAGGGGKADRLECPESSGMSLRPRANFLVFTGLFRTFRFGFK